MNKKTMSKMMDRILKKVSIMRQAGQSEYAHDNDNVFANFNRISDLLEVDRKKVLMTYMLKHVDGIAAFVKGHRSQREDVRGRITDCIVYLTLLWGMIEEEDGILSREKNDAPLHNVLKSVPTEDKDLSVDNGLRSTDRIHTESNLQQMRTTRDRIQESQKVGAA